MNLKAYEAMGLKRSVINPRLGHLALELVGLVLLGAVLAMLALAAAQGYRIYQRFQAVRADESDMESLQLGSLQPDAIERAGPLLERTASDLSALRAEVTPWLPLSRGLGWLPIYGGDLAQLDDLLATGSGVTQAARHTYEALAPAWSASQSRHDITAAGLAKMLLDARPQLLEAQASFNEARAARARVDVGRLSPATRRLVQRLDRSMSTLDESLSFAVAIPGLLGGTESGPKTYLILVENEDELRPTGGFISAVGKAVISNGQLIDLRIDDSYSIDDLNKAYPAAPWQMQQFMNIPIMVFRDASWFTDFPTAARWAQYLHAYSNSNSVDGVIAIDQSLMAALLSVIGPVQVPEIQTTVTADNLRTVMRAQKIPPPLAQRDPNWHRKQFMNPIASAILRRLTSDRGIPWEKLLQAMIGELDQHHMLVQLDDPALTRLLAERGWDGAVRNDAGDFLMVVDTNVGYNKTNAVVAPEISYEVNLTDLSAPTSALVISYANKAQGGDRGCDQYPPAADQAPLEQWYPIDRCYYDYLRVYAPAGTRYVRGVPQSVRREQMVMLVQDVPARVDTLDERIANVQGFGTLLVVPMGRTIQTGMEFRLPGGIIQAGNKPGEKIYRLKVQKQAGTQAIPMTLRVHLPAGAKINFASSKFIQAGADLLFKLELTSDINIEIGFVS